MLLESLHVSIYKTINKTHVAAVYIAFFIVCIFYFSQGCLGV